jgi:PEP-CTERM motif
MKTIIKNNIVAAILLILALRCQSQGFLNLNFESAKISGYSPGDDIPTAEAFPGWSAYYGTTGDPTSSSASTVAYDGISTGGALISLDDSNAYSPYGPIEGNYSAVLFGEAGTAVSLGQTGAVPSTAQTLVFWANVYGGLDVSFDGQALSLVDVSNAVNYTVFEANISAYAGQTGQLLFTAPVDTTAVFDNIQFSTSPVPEPSAFALCALGGLSLAWRRRKRSSV